MPTAQLLWVDNDGGDGGDGDEDDDTVGFSLRSRCPLEWQFATLLLLGDMKFSFYLMVEFKVHTFLG